MAKGKLIVLEGTDGAGKSTQIKFIKEYIEKNKLTYDYLHFPMYGHNEFSQIIAAFLRGEYGKASEVNPYFVADIYAGDRFLYLPELEKKLEEYDVVLLDRYVFSNIAYQAAKYPEDSLEHRNITTWIWDLEFELNHLPYPDLTLFLDVPIDVTSKRLSEKREGEDRSYLEGKTDIHEEDIDLQHKVRDVYINEELNGAADYHIIKTWSDVQLQGEGGLGRRMYGPEELFKKYEHLIKNTINGL